MKFEFKNMSYSTLERFYNDYRDDTLGVRLFSCELDTKDGQVVVTDLVTKFNQMPSWNITGGSVCINRITKKSQEAIGYRLIDIHVGKMSKNKFYARLDFIKDVEVPSLSDIEKEMDIVKSAISISNIPVTDELISTFKLDQLYDINISFNN